jgi:hypothetical protein
MEIKHVTARGLIAGLPKGTGAFLYHVGAELRVHFDYEYPDDPQRIEWIEIPPKH